MLAGAFAACCHGQLQTVQIRLTGLDCASCASSVEPRLKRVRGVATAFYYPEKSVARANMAEDNRVTLHALRDAVKGLGYTPGDVELVVIGIVKDGRLSLPHQADAFVLENADNISGRVRVEGSVAAGTNTLKPRTATKLE